ncbi:MAG: LLM class flavin-dependent oxidoreductase, partial [Gammaproteobacteria bacterium]|nr:LLM class flavin-dependent oxidoreductase [Gammaproteobacteria bacterium]
MSNPDASLKFGILLEPFHPTNGNPDCALEQGLELITFLDSLGYDYAWVGDHHSDGFGNAGFGNNSTGNIESPDVFIKMAAERTRNIRLGACVSSLSSQHPLVLADRIMQLDHVTRGRV